MHFARDANEAEDIVQDALMSAFGSLKHFRGDSSFFTWLYRIAINSAKHSWNQSARRLPRFSDISDTSDNDHMLDDREIDLETPEALMESRQILRLLNDVIERLPPEQREALLLRELDGLSYEEIAAAMHCPVGTVRSRVSRAREAISAAISISLDGPMSKH
jgi:RNA polymerase sigma-70 factor (ECF subfamily)